MSLQVWLPLTKDLRQQGLSSVVATNNGATYSSTNGKLGGCYSFPATGGNLNIPSNAMSNFAASNGCSLAFWIKLNTWNTSYETYFQAGTGSTPWNNYIFGVLRNSTNSTICFTIGNGSSASNANYLTSAWQTGVWFHMAFTYETGKCKIYKDGVLDKEYTTSIIPDFSKITKITIGRCNNDSNYQTDCNMNDFRIYDHCLSEREVKKLAQGLIVHYSLNRNGWGQDNLISNSTIKASSGYYVSNWTCTANTSVSNWGCTDAYRCTGSGGTNTIIGTLGIGQPSNSNFTYSYSVWVKNNHSTNKIAFSCNHYGAYSEWLNPGQAKRLILEACPGNGSSYIQLNWRTNTVGEAFDFSYWRPKIEIGNKVTSWCPNSSDELATFIGLNDSTEYDISGFCNNGTRVGTFEWTSDTPKYSVSTIFNASHSDYIKIPYTNYAVQGAKEMTWSIWAYDDDWSTYSGRIYSCTEGGGVNIEDGGSTLNWAVNMYTAADYSTYAYQGYCSISKASLSSGWHMFTWVYTTTGTKVYVDGVLKSTIDINSYGVHFANTALYLGAEAQGETTSTGYYLTGKLSDFRIYTTALSANDVKSLHQNCAIIDSDGTIYGQIRN